MNSFSNSRAFVGLILFASLSLVGCKGSDNPKMTAPVTQTKPEPKSKEAHIADAMAKLSDEDRQLAMSQKVCPVSDQALGSMGAPIKVNVGGRDVFVCCDGCTDSLKTESEKYLAKLPPAAAAK